METTTIGKTQPTLHTAHFFSNFFKTFHISVDDKVYVDLVHNNHIYEIPANSGWVWLGDPWHHYTNPDFQIRRLYYGPRTDAQKYGLLNWKNKIIHVSYAFLMGQCGKLRNFTIWNVTSRNNHAT